VLGRGLRYLACSPFSRLSNYLVWLVVAVLLANVAAALDVARDADFAIAPSFQYFVFPEHQASTYTPSLVARALNSRLLLLLGDTSSSN
jgi:hypothetical protein